MVVVVWVGGGEALGKYVYCKERFLLLYHAIMDVAGWFHNLLTIPSALASGLGKNVYLAASKSSITFSFQPQMWLSSFRIF